MEVVAQRDPRDPRPVIIMAQDEGRFGRISDPRPCWAPKGIRPIAPRKIVREYLYSCAAVCPELGKMTCLLLPYANTEMRNIFLDEVSHDFKDYFAVMLVDQAAWHQSKDLMIPENIRLIPQTPQSGVEPGGTHMGGTHGKRPTNIAFASLDELEDALCKEPVKLGNDPKRLRSLTHFPYLRVRC